MSLVVPNASEIDILQTILTPALTFRLYSNNVTPGPADVAATYTEVAGGGYASKALVYGSWIFTAGAPSYASYAQQTWTFTGATNAPSTVYGYYVTRNTDGKLMWAERFPVAMLPFAPVAGSLVKITPKFTGGSVY